VTEDRNHELDALKAIAKRAYESFMATSTPAGVSNVGEFALAVDILNLIPKNQ